VLGWDLSPHLPGSTTVTVFMCVCLIELSHSRAEHDAMKQQAESTNREYDRLMKEHASLQVCSLSVMNNDTMVTSIQVM